MKITREELQYKQSRPLSEKIEMSQCVIETWWKHWDSKVYIAFSGGKDSTVLLHLVRSLFPDVPAVFSDTGLEYPELKDFVHQQENVTIIRPELSFWQVIKKYGYPIISKQVSMGLNRYRVTTSEVQRQLRLWGGINPSSGKKQQPSIPKKYHYLINAPFFISEKCCDVMKKVPFKKYEKTSKRKPYIGTKALDSNIRTVQYLMSGCNSFDNLFNRSLPLSFWSDQDIWEYLHINNLSYAKIYDMGEKKTGCMFCMFGIQFDGVPNRFQRMKNTHSKIYDYVMNDIGLKQVLDYIGVPYE